MDGEITQKIRIFPDSRLFPFYSNSQHWFNVRKSNEPQNGVTTNSRLELCVTHSEDKKRGIFRIFQESARTDYSQFFRCFTRYMYIDWAREKPNCLNRSARIISEQRL